MNDQIIFEDKNARWAKIFSEQVWRYIVGFGAFMFFTAYFVTDYHLSLMVSCVCLIYILCVKYVYQDTYIKEISFRNNSLQFTVMKKKDIQSIVITEFDQLDIEYASSYRIPSRYPDNYLKLTYNGQVIIKQFEISKWDTDTIINVVQQLHDLGVTKITAKWFFKIEGWERKG